MKAAVLDTPLRPPRSRPAVEIWLIVWAGGWWAWAIWTCAEPWQYNANYSYGWTVPFLAIAFAMRRAWRAGDRAAGGMLTSGILAFFALGAAFVLPLEWARQEQWHPEMVLWIICGASVAISLASVWLVGGWNFLRVEIFPHLFFFTAVPWPPRFEQPVTAALMRGVSELTAELLHWCGVEAQTSGAAIALRSGLVGITEACSGIRSLQAGLMFGLAMGEWFLLRPGRRVALLAVALSLAIATNLARTLLLCFQAEWHGIESVERVHDLIGNCTITALIIGIWIGGKLLSFAGPAATTQTTADFAQWLRQLFSRPYARTFGPPNRKARSLLPIIVTFGVVAFIASRGLHAYVESREHVQKEPFFRIRADAETGNALVPVPHSIWAELAPTSGEYIRHRAADLSGVTTDAYHFFWKPSVWNQFVLVHRPDICMPGVGWVQVGVPEPVDLPLGSANETVRCYAFRFRRGNVEALQLWGIWRNGAPVPLDYTAAQALGSVPPPPALGLGGKRRSATEIISCSVIESNGTPRLETARDLLKSVFSYQKINQL